MRWGALALAVAAVIYWLAVPPSSSEARGLRLGILDPVFRSTDPTTRGEWLSRTKDAGAQYVEIFAAWNAISPRDRPAGFDPADPADPSYDWENLDAAVRDATARGLTVILVAAGAPSWAEGPGRPTTARAGTWRPNPAEYGAFAQALAARYSGSFPDPLNSGVSLPRVRYYKAWNEPNLPQFLGPQWEAGKPRSPVIYRDLVVAMYEAVNRVDPGNKLIAGGQVGTGNPDAGRMRPLAFLRKLLCLRGRRKLRPTRCRARARFDILAHNPINASTPPGARAPHPDDAPTAELRPIKRILHRATRKRRALPRRNKPFWISEFWWPSDPPTGFGVPLDKQARWLAEALYLYWKQGVRVAFWFQIRDPDPDRPSLFDVGTGLHFFDGDPKPALQAFRFPLVTGEAKGNRKARVWGISPERRSVRIQSLHGGDWRTVDKARPRTDGIFVARVRLRRGERLRAVAGGGETSLVWRHR